MKNIEATTPEEIDKVHLRLILQERTMIKKIITELNESIVDVENAMGDNTYDYGYYEALLMVRDKIIKPLQKTNK